MKKIAVLIPVYNNEEGLIRSLNSLEAEEILLDIVVVNDGSEKEPVIPKGDFKNNIILLNLSENQGIEIALNRGLEYILQNSYDYVGRLDAGDLIVKGRFEKQVNYLECNKEYMLVGSDVEYIDTDGNHMFNIQLPKGYKQIRKKMHVNSCFLHPAVLIRVSVLKSEGLYSTNFKAAEDYELFFRIISKHKSENLNEILTITEYNAGGISLTKRKEQLKSRFEIQLEYFDFKKIESYNGILKTIVLYIMPVKVITFIKKIVSKSK
ncbi:glycosyltransferase [Bacillus wiedmannii]|uniref:glycosyltransferase n=1 Tax=Bacillus wiedmannii TaxID=1890302 RepID=UPI000BEF2E6B|nr:glycosyltransferase [Bacillus wiedmannii]PEL82494.1 glycosyl transferase family 2 [Bacillus wiedmannii]